VRKILTIILSAKAMLNRLKDSGGLKSDNFNRLLKRIADQGAADTLSLWELRKVEI